MPPNLAEISVDSLVSAISGHSLRALAWGWARALPVAVIVPAFGLPSMPGALRGAIALGIGGIALTAGEPVTGVPKLSEVVSVLLDGVVIAIAAALGIWIATMAGELYDEMTHAEAVGDGPFVGSRSRTGTLFGFVATIVFLGNGGPSRLAAALCVPVASSPSTWKRTAMLVTSGIETAINVAAPLVCAAVLMEVCALVIVRQTPILAAKSLAHSLTGFFRLVVLALFLEWLLLGLARMV